MKGTVITCLREIVINAGGEATWQACLSAADFEEFTVFHLAEDVPDHKALALIQAVCAKLGLTLDESHRRLIDVAVGMARAMGRYYGARLVVTKLSSKALRIVFA